MNANWLTQLAPEHAPAPPAWWPLAPGWWIVAALCILAMIMGAWWWVYSTRVHYRRQRRIALKELQRISTASHDSQVTARAIQNLLRRYALAIFDHERVAKLSGQAWLGFVTSHGGGLFSGEVGRSLLSAAFGSDAAHHQREQWLAAAEAFIKHASPSLKEMRP